MSSVSAVIPARLGSKRVLKKNFRPLCQKPLVTWTIEAAIEANIFDQIILSSDYVGAERIAKEFNIEFDLRDPWLATDQAQPIDLIEDLVSKRRLTNSNLMLLQPTSPLRTARQINEAFRHFSRSEIKQRSLVSVFDHTSQYLKSLKQTGNFVEYAHRSQSGVELQNVPRYFAQNGAIYIVDTNTAIENRSFIYSACLRYQMDRLSSVDIDTWEDFELAEILMEKQLENKMGLEVKL